MSTAGTIIGHAYSILKTDGDSVSTPGLQQSMMLTVLSWANSEWARTFRRGGGEGPNLLERETGFDLVASTTLSATQASGAATASLTDSTAFPTAGAIAVYDDGPDIQEHTGNAGNVLTGVTGCDWGHEASDTVIKLYALPANFSTFRFQNGYPVYVSGVGYDFTSDDPQGREFSIYENGTTRYLWLPPDISGTCRVLYNKSSTTIDSTDDTVDVPAEYEQFLVFRLVEHGRRVRGDNADKVLESQQQANTILLEAQKEKNVRRGVMVRPIRTGRPHIRGITAEFYPWP